jgi:hypothetical protein
MHVPILSKKKNQFNLIFSEKIIQYSNTFALQVKRHGTKPMHPSLSRAFERHQKHNLKHPNSKQNKLPSFIGGQPFLKQIKKSCSPKNRILNNL